MSDRLSNLLRADKRREEAAVKLEEQLVALTRACESYRQAFIEATRAGWAKTDLMGARYVDPSRLPRPARSRRTSANEEPSQDTAKGGW